MFAKSSSAVFGLLALAASVQAHFQMQYPDPRGPFVEDDEPTFCDGYNNTASRTTFPLGQGFIVINSEHPSWNAQVLLSKAADPASDFSDFNTSAVQFFSASGEGTACFAIDIQRLNVSGIQDGSNVTIQVEFNGGDGALFQCADLTLSSNATIPSNVTCSNLVSNTTTNAISTSTSTSISSTSSSGALPLAVEGSGLLGLAAAAFLSLL